jgi:hypothetical protein
MAYKQETIDLIIEKAKTMSVLEISREMKISPTTIYKMLKNNGLKNNTKKILNDVTVDFTDEQLEVLYGSLLGDMCIQKETINARASITQGGKQEEYFDHKCEIFKNFIGAVSKTPRFDKRTNKYYNKYMTRLSCHPKLTEIYNMLIVNGVKTITREYLDLLTPRSIAYWFMDDGCNNGTLATMCFSKEENEIIAKYFFEKHGIDATVSKFSSGTGWTINFRKSQKVKLFKLIEPYIIESMKYKIEVGPVKPCELLETPESSQATAELEIADVNA